jgi:hypothetical protein
MRVDRQTDRDMTKLIVAFHNFANASEKGPSKWFKHLCTEMRPRTDAEINLTFLCRLVFQNIFVRSFKF